MAKDDKRWPRMMRVKLPDRSNTNVKKLSHLHFENYGMCMYISISLLSKRLYPGKEATTLSFPLAQTITLMLQDM